MAPLRKWFKNFPCQGRILLTTLSLLLGQCPTLNGSICEPIRIALCLPMPYNITQFPNLLHHTTQTNANLVLDQFQPLVESNCSSLLVFYLCSLFVPVCPIHFRQEVIPPCRGVCQTVRTGCEPVLVRFNITWPEELSCEELPRHETGVCISPESIDHTPASVSNHSSNGVVEHIGTSRKPASCVCPQTSSRPSPRKAYLKRKFHYVVRATYLRTERITGNLQVLSIKVSRVLKKSKTAIPLRRRIGLWMEDRCTCPRLIKGSDYLFMGFEDGQRKMLTFNSSSVAEPWKRNWPMYIKKWEKRATKHQQNRRMESKRRTNKPRTGGQ